jgi:excisionase family DNA binding protein
VSAQGHVWVLMTAHTPTLPTLYPEYFTPEQLAKRWAVSQMTLRRWRTAGRLKASRFGRAVRFHRSEVQAFEKQAQVEFPHEV